MTQYTTAYNTAKGLMEALQTEIAGIPAQVTQLEGVRDAALAEKVRLESEYATKVTPSKI